MNQGLYKIINKLNGKFYIGSTNDFSRRWYAHVFDLNRNQHVNPHLQNAWNLYGEQNFMFQIYRLCEETKLLIEEQKELDMWVGKEECYNIRSSATCPVSPGEKRSEEVKRKISDTQKGVPRWTEEQKIQMSVDRKGRRHTSETIKKFKNRPKFVYTGIVKAQKMNDGRIYPKEHGQNISKGKLLNPKKFDESELQKIRIGVRNAILEGRYKKGKVPKSEYENIKSLYLSGSMNQRKLAFKYGVTPPSMARLLIKMGVK